MLVSTDTEIILIFFLFGLISGLALSLLFLRAERRPLALATLLTSLWTATRILGWTAVSMMLVYAALALAIYCLILLFRYRTIER
jgi:hypothetical protein